MHEGPPASRVFSWKTIVSEFCTKEFWSFGVFAERVLEFWSFRAKSFGVSEFSFGVLELSFSSSHLEFTNHGGTGDSFRIWPHAINQCTQTTGMDVVTHTKHAFIQGTPHSHTLLSRIRECWPALRTAAIRGRSGATRASAPCSLLCCSKLSWLLSWVRLPSPSRRRHG